MRKIAYVANSRIPSRAANTVHVLNMSCAFAAQGHKVALVARGEPDAAATVFEDYGLDCRFDLSLLPVTRPAFLDRLRFLRHARRTFVRAGFDFAYGRSGYGLLAGVPRSVPFAYDLHIFPAGRSQRRLEALLFRRPNFLFATAITRALADKYVSVYPHLRDRILVAPCAATLPPEVPVEKGREPGPPRVYYVGHLYEGRGIDLIVGVAGLEPDIEFHIVGGEDSDIAFWRAEAPRNVTFHGYVRPSELAAHYRRADLCIAPHQAKVAPAGGGDIAPWMSPMKIFEYMAHAKPIVAADLPVIREIVSSGTEGILCPPGDTETWREAIRALADDAQLRAKLGKAGRRKLELRYTWERRARSILDFAERLMSGSDARAVSTSEPAGAAAP